LDLLDLAILALRLALVAVLYGFLVVVLRAAGRGLRTARPAYNAMHLIVLEPGSSALIAGQVITAADGMYLIDSDGRRYLDGVSSLWCNVHGHRVPEIDDAIRRQLDKVAHTTMLGLASEPAILLADRLMQIVPRNLKKVFYSDAGATATEIAFKLAAQYWYNIGRAEKNEFIGFVEAYHGDTVGAMSVGRVPAFHRPYFPLLFKVHAAPSPHVYRPPLPQSPRASDGNVFPTSDEVRHHCLAALEQILSTHSRTLAAICIEPLVQGAGGIITHPHGFLAEVRRLATQYDVLLICDEVATGFGRTGKMFACAHESVEPDLTLEEIQRRLLDERQQKAGLGSVWRFFDRHGISFKKKRSGSRAGSA